MTTPASNPTITVTPSAIAIRYQCDYMIEDGDSAVRCPLPAEGVINGSVAVCAIHWADGRRNFA